MIPTTNVGDNQFDRARELAEAHQAPVVVLSSRTYLIPSSTRGELDHKVQLDDFERPAAVSCTCEAGRMSKACWGMARVLTVVSVLHANHVYVSRDAASSLEALAAEASALLPLAEARFVEGDVMSLTWGGHPKSKALYVVP
jgi:hypothetical protein